MKTRSSNLSIGSALKILTSICLICVVITISCGRDSTGPQADLAATKAALSAAPTDPTLEIISHTDCLTYGDGDEDPYIPSTQTAVMWEYDGNGNLDLRRLNAGLNCCPDLAFSVDLTDRVITVMEQDNGICDCFCLLNVDLRVSDIKPGKYLLRFEEFVSIGEDEPLECEVTLKGVGSSGMFTAERTLVPWGDIQYPPSGAFIGFHPCGINNTVVDVPDELNTSYCFTWEYDQNQTLKLGQHNSMINCCMDTLYVTFDFSGNVITIDEVDTLSYICPCFCAFGADLEIHNLPAGEYTFRVNEPFYDMTFEFTVDLLSQPLGYYAPFASSR
ncbi:MAG: hypothetical protein AB1483_03020 [Candidatus Zixiibacteriota bacterium]